MPPLDATALCPLIADAARAAGEAIMAVYASDFDARQKSDSSPVTDADEAATSTDNLAHQLDEELSEDVDDIIHKIGSRILLNQEASRP